MTEPLRFEVPGPPVPCERARVVAGRGAYTPPRTRAYEAHVAACALAARMACDWRDSLVCGDVEFAVTIELWHGDARRRDLDNGSKSILDGMTRAGVWADDSQVAALTVRRGVDRARPRAVVVVEVLG